MRMLSVLILLVTLSEARAGLDGAIGVMGDSYSDEYQFYPPDRSTARNWVEILAQTRGLDFGAFSTVSRGEPRNQGYADNWARSDATTDDLIATGQHTGLAAQVTRGEVKLVMICVGGNDFINALKSPEPTATLAEVLPRALANYRLAVHTILDADPRVKLVLATLADIRNLPEFDGPIRAGRLPREVANAFSAAIRKFNAQIKVLAAADRRIAVLDLDGTTHLANLVRRDTVCVDGLRLDRTHPSNSLDAFFLGDSRHPGTIGQGLLAKLFIDTINARFDAGIAPLSEREIVAYARSIPPSPAWGLDRRLTDLGVGSRNPASSPGQ